MSNTITIMKKGLLTHIQDLGRPDFLSQGIPESGAMDLRALKDANYLLHLPAGAPALEMTYLGPTIRFDQDTVFVLTGADMKAKLGDRPIQTYCPYAAREGDILTLSVSSSLRYGYLQVGGGFHIAPELGSCSTYMKCGIGGFRGRALTDGDILPVRECGEDFRSSLLVRDASGKDGEDLSPVISLIPVYPKEKVVRVVLGPQWELFPEAGQNTFLSAAYTVSSLSDRMGYRLEGAKIDTGESSDIISDGTVLGSIQVTSEGKPIVLLSDRQTTGGYKKIACVISPDIPLLSQCLPGEKIRFEAVSLKEAARLYKKERKREKAFLRKAGK